MAQVVDGPEDAITRELTARGSRPALLKALSSLSRGDRDVLLLVAWSDMTYEEAARAIGSPVGTVKSRLNRARRKVREVLGWSPGRRAGRGGPGQIALIEVMENENTRRPGVAWQFSGRLTDGPVKPCEVVDDPSAHEIGDATPPPGG